MFSAPRQQEGLPPYVVDLLNSGGNSWYVDDCADFLLWRHDVDTLRVPKPSNDGGREYLYQVAGKRGRPILLREFMFCVTQRPYCIILRLISMIYHVSPKRIIPLRRHTWTTLSLQHYSVRSTSRTSQPAITFENDGAMPAARCPYIRCSLAFEFGLSYPSSESTIRSNVSLPGIAFYSDILFRNTSDAAPKRGRIRGLATTARYAVDRFEPN
ncbi:hypothetical protein EV421DRAFT_1131935 [Armillaria borealis]|uniref:Uncharacterized protein n=1 Tax=Armillaria borealis TaxID=47425 RepID=A0AA39MJ42_9AGAR|nr:hypothetical protein EV421DRAFT_1131935 [Armillaria borealis]